MRISDLSWSQLQAFLLNDRKMSPKTSAMAALKSRYKTLQIWFQDREFDRTLFTEFIGWMNEQGYSASYKNNFTKLVKNIERYWEIKFKRPRELNDFSYFRENRSWMGDTLTPEEIKRLATVEIPYLNLTTRKLINSRNQCLIMLLGTTGCRISEALDLRIEDVRGSPPFVIFRDTKSDEDRTVPICQELYEQIMKLPRTEALVFTSARSSKRLALPEINNDLKARAKVCGINKKVYNHLFRHSYISTMRERGVDFLDIAKLVGHRDPKTTMRYSHSNIEYYSKIILRHPLIQANMPIAQKVEHYLSRVKDLGGVLSYSLDGTKLTSTIDLS